MEAETIDKILNGAITIVQPERGYRFSVDSILLGHFARARSRDRVLELGAGCGVVSVMVAVLNRPRSVIAIELQSTLAAFARRNATLNGLVDLQVIEADLRARSIQGVAPGSFDLIIANPPYRAEATGRKSPDPSRGVARGSSGSNLEVFVSAAARFCRNGGRFVCVFAANRSAELIALLNQNRLEPKRLRFVHPFRHSPAGTVLIEARKNGGRETVVEPPLILWSRVGTYSEEALELLRSRAAAANPDSGGKLTRSEAQTLSSD
jgi:tRNA1Val (adenine37-N6)-methyltransferase